MILGLLLVVFSISFERFSPTEKVLAHLFSLKVNLTVAVISYER